MDAVGRTAGSRHPQPPSARRRRDDRQLAALRTTFTNSRFPSTPRAAADEAQRAKLIAARTVELANALATPGQDERRLFARELFAKQGTAPLPRPNARVLPAISRTSCKACSPRAEITRELQTAGRAGSTSDQFSRRSRVFRDRGLSLDTSFRPSFALEQALVQLRQRGLLKPGTIREVVIGPGLDFTDKKRPDRLYPQQTLQPFALIDSLLRVGVIKDPASIRLTTLDISPRVNDHLRRARRRASAGESHRSQAAARPRCEMEGAGGRVLKIAGDRVGRAAPASRARLPAANVDVRTVTVRPAVTLRIEPLDLNVVLQRSATHQFDLVVATNVPSITTCWSRCSHSRTSARCSSRVGCCFRTTRCSNCRKPVCGRSACVTTEYSEVRDDGDHRLLPGPMMLATKARSHLLILRVSVSPWPVSANFMSASALDRGTQALIKLSCPPGPTAATPKTQSSIDAPCTTNE